MAASNQKTRRLVLILGDQLNADSAALDNFDNQQDCLWMAEVRHESTVVPSHKARTVLFLSAMRHFRDAQQEKDRRVWYSELTDDQNRQELGAELIRALRQLKPETVQVVQPGEFRVQEDLVESARSEGYELEILPDRHFFTTPQEFAEHADGRKELRMEYFYREQRKRFDLLMDGDQPEGGQWNFDKQNREQFPRSGPPKHKHPRSFRQDRITRQVIDLVHKQLPDNPGSLQHFDWPVTPRQAKQALDDFVEYRLPQFGDYQDAMWEGESQDPYLFHSRLSAAMNLKLIDPRKVVQAAIQAYHDKKAPLPAVEGFVRQILGWREYVRGVYWWKMPEYLERNAMDAQHDLPDFYWTGDTQMNCLKQAIQQTLQYGYAHHIQRLMVTGLFGLLLGVDPVQMHRWYLSVYVDAVEWVELPNTLGMSQYADGGIMASKPYVATGKYVKRMSNYCQNCRFDPASRKGSDACPFTVLYWDYLLRHRDKLEDNHRMGLQLKNLERLDPTDKQTLQQQANQIRAEIPCGSDY